MVITRGEMDGAGDEAAASAGGDEEDRPGVDAARPAWLAAAWRGRLAAAWRGRLAAVRPGQPGAPRRGRRVVVVGVVFCLGLLAGVVVGHVGPFGSAGDREDTALVAGGIPGVVAAESRRVDARREASAGSSDVPGPVVGSEGRGPSGSASPSTSPGGSVSPGGSPTAGSSTGGGGRSGPDTAAQALAAGLAGPVGAAAVRGPALTVELNDAPASSRHGPYPPGVAAPGPDDLVVHQQDVQAVVNALWAGGAEAMTIMDRRVTARTAVRCVGNTLLLGGEVFSPPFRITAIGDIAALRAHLRDDPQVTIYRQYVSAYRLGYRVTENPDARLPAADLRAASGRPGAEPN